MKIAYIGHDRVLRVHDTLNPDDEDFRAERAGPAL